MNRSSKGKHHRRRQPNRFVRFFKTPKGTVLVALILLAAISILIKHDTASLWTLLVAAATGLVVDLIVGLFYRKKRYFSDGGLITGLIVGLVLSSFTSWYVTALTVVIALASKHVLRIKRKPIFNPAAVGLLISTYAFSTMQNWWGGLSLISSWYVWILAIIGAYVAWRVKKIPQVISFVGSYSLICAVFMLFKATHLDASFGFQNPLWNSALFLAFFMVTDPPTSPAKRFHQIWFGCVTGVVSAGMYLLFPGELVYLFVGLLIANAGKTVQTLLTNNRVRGTSNQLAQVVQGE